MPSIFLNYRKGDHSISVAALAERLTQHFGEDEVFIDNGMPAGTQYSRRLEEALRGCDVLVSVIHKDWVATFDTSRRKDWVKYEIATALERGITVIPVLLENAKTPAWDKLPREIADISMLQYTQLRSRDFRSDMNRLVARIEHHVDLDTDTPPSPPVKTRPKRTGLLTAGLAVLLFLVAFAIFSESGPLWRRFAMPAFVSAALLVVASSLTVIMTWSLKGPGTRWEQKAGIRSHREELSRNWLLPALLIVVCAFFVSRSLTVGGWQEWEWWLLVVAVLLSAAYLHRWWRLTTAGDDAWPPPVTTDHRVFRRAALRLHDRLTNDKAWSRPRRPRTAHRQAVSIYQDLVQVRAELTARAALPITRWVRAGHNGQTTFYLSWFTSIVLLDLSATAALVFGDPVPGSPLRLIAVTVVGAAAFTAAMVTTHFLLDRHRVRTWIDELTHWQKDLAPLIFGDDQPAHEKTHW